MQTLFLNAAITDATRREPRLGNVLVEDGLIRDVRVVRLAEIARIPGLPRSAGVTRGARLARRRADYETRVR